MAQIYKTWIKILKHPSVYYFICFVFKVNIEKQYQDSHSPGDPKLLSIINILDWIYMASFPLIVLIYLNIKSIIKKIFALIIIAGAYYIVSYLKLFIDYAMGTHYFGNLLSSIFSALSYTIFDFIFILLCAKLTKSTIKNKETILTVVFNLFIIYFVVTNLEIVNFAMKIFIQPILFFIFWDYFLKKYKNKNSSNEVRL